MEKFKTVKEHQLYHKKGIYKEKKIVASEYLLTVLYFLTCKMYQSLVVKEKKKSYCKSVPISFRNRNFKR